MTTDIAPGISVVMPSYNSRASIRRAIDSVLAQTFDNLELIVVDDASSDGTPSVVEEACRTSPKIKLIRLDRNQGPSRARNIAISQSRGAWVAVLDADDAWRPTRLEHLLADVTEVDVIFDNLIGRDPTTRAEVGPLFGVFANGPLRAEDLLAAHVHGSDYDFGYLKPLIRRSFLLAHNLSYDESLRTSEDLLLYASLLFAGARTRLVDTPLYVYTLPVDAGGRASQTSNTLPRDKETWTALERLRQRYADRLSPTELEALDERIAYLKRVQPLAEFYYARRRGDYRTMATLLFREHVIRRDVVAKLRLRLLPHSRAAPLPAAGRDFQR